METDLSCLKCSVPHLIASFFRVDPRTCVSYSCPFFLASTLSTTSDQHNHDKWRRERRLLNNHLGRQSVLKSIIWEEASRFALGCMHLPSLFPFLLRSLLNSLRIRVERMYFYYVLLWKFRLSLTDTGCVKRKWTFHRLLASIGPHKLPSYGMKLRLGGQYGFCPQRTSS